MVIYIAEAHADDEWPVASARYNCGQEVHVNQTHSTCDRVDRAKFFYKRFSYCSEDESLYKMRPLVSVPQNEIDLNGLKSFGFEEIYKPWPFRAYGFVNHVLDFIAEPHACEIRISELSDWLENQINSLLLHGQ